ncbi:unnamed protein product, partial [Chrysoparadoxa australica]
MKKHFTIKSILILTLFLINTTLHAQGTVEAEIDTSYHYQFDALRKNNNQNILIDKGHNTIYSNESGVITAREMFRIIKEDGYEVEFTDATLNATLLKEKSPNLLVLHGMPNDKVKLELDSISETLYLSPLKNEEVESIG